MPYLSTTVIGLVYTASLISVVRSMGPSQFVSLLPSPLQICPQPPLPQSLVQ